MDTIPLSDESEDQYDLGALLGQGGFGKVIKAYHRLQEKDVALKIIPFAVLTSDEIRKRIENEIKIHRKLSHHNIIGFYGCFIDRQQYYLVLECANGNNLFQFVKSFGAMSETKATVIVYQILSALQYLHRRNIVHRDIKLSNLLVMHSSSRLGYCNNNSYSISNGHNNYSISSEKSKERVEDLVIKLCDFGLAVEVSHPDDDQYTFCGTPSYMAPELSTRSDCGFPVDIWATGIVFKALLSGLLPVTASTSLPVSSNSPLEDLPDKVSSEVMSFLRGVFTEEPRKRPSASRLLQHPLLVRYQREISLLQEANHLSSISTYTYTTKVSSLSSAYSFASSSPFSPINDQASKREVAEESEMPRQPPPASLPHYLNSNTVRSNHHSSNRTSHGTSSGYSVPNEVSSLRASHSITSHRSTTSTSTTTAITTTGGVTRSDLFSTWSKISQTVKALPPLFFSPSSSSSVSRSINSNTTTNTTSPNTSTTNSNSLTEAMFVSQEGDLFYCYKQYKVYLSLSRGEAESSLAVVKLGKWTSEDKQRLLQFSVSLSTNSSSGVLHCFDDLSYPLRPSQSQSKPHKTNNKSNTSNSNVNQGLAIVMDLTTFPKSLSSHDLFLSLITSSHISTSTSSSNEGKVKSVVASLLARVAVIVERVSCQLPRLTIFTFDPVDSLTPPSSSSSSSRSQRITSHYKTNPSHKGERQSIKCMFMSNRPLPDFHIQWKDRTRLVYSLQTNSLSISRPATADCPAVRWEGVVDLSGGGDRSSSNSNSNNSNSGTVAVVPDLLQPFLLSGQLVVLKCLKEERRFREMEKRDKMKENHKERKERRIASSDGSPAVIFLD